MKTKRSLLYVSLIALVAGSLLIRNGIVSAFGAPQLINEPLHSTVEALGALASITMAVLLLQRGEGEGLVRAFPLAMGFLGMGLLDAFHGVASRGHGFVFLHAMGSLTGGLWFALVWLPPVLSARLAGTKRWMPWLVAAASVSIWLWTILFPERLPVMLLAEQFTTVTVLINGAAALLFLAAIGHFLGDFHRTAGIETYFFIIMASLFSLTELAFLYRTPWAPEWWFWHALRLSAFLLVMGLVFSDYQRKGSDLRVSEERLRAIIDNTSAVIYMKDADGRYLLINRQYEKLFGVTLDEIRGKTDYEVFPAEMADVFRANDLQVLAGGTLLETEETAPQEDGPHTYISIKVPLVDASGMPYAICGISTDITERKRDEESIKQLNRDLERKAAELAAINRELEAFSYSISHDLRAPLRSVDGFSHALLEDYSGKLDAEGEDNLKRIRAASQRMGQLIDDMLRLSRVTRNEMEIRAVDLSALVRLIGAELREAEPAREVKFAIASDIVARGDPQLLKMALSNLIGNAWKFTGKSPVAKIEFGTTQQNGETAYFVRDNGSGFDMSYSDQLFGAFQRLHSASEFPGTGIGLAIVQRIIHRHGGRVWAESEVGKGATFYFTLSRP